MTLRILDLDIAKQTFNVCLLHHTGRLEHAVFANTRSGFEHFTTWLLERQHGQFHCCLEATGTYGDALAAYLHDAGYVVSSVNPAAIKAFAASRLSRTKTDRVDAALIGHCCRAQQPPPWTPPAPEVRQLQARVCRLEAPVEMRGMEHNRHQAGSTSPTVTASIAAHLAYLDAAMRQLEHAIQAHSTAHASLFQQHTLLQSIPGVGATTAAVFLAEVDVAPYTSARQVAAFAGLVPCIRQSGSSVRGIGGARQGIDSGW